jgi:hypothetical protein
LNPEQLKTIDFLTKACKKAEDSLNKKIKEEEDSLNEDFKRVEVDERKSIWEARFRESLNKRKSILEDRFRKSLKERESIWEARLHKLLNDKEELEKSDLMYADERYSGPFASVRNVLSPEQWEDFLNKKAEMYLKVADAYGQHSELFANYGKEKKKSWLQDYYSQDPK